MPGALCMTAPRRTWDTGLVRPYREPPCDFRELFLRFGQSKELEEHYRTNWRVIRRWIEVSGGDELRAERARVAGTTLRPGLRRRRYVLGMTLTAVKVGEEEG